MGEYPLCKSRIMKKCADNQTNNLLIYYKMKEIHAKTGLYTKPTLKVVRFVVEKGFSGSNPSKTMGLVQGAGDQNIESRRETSYWGNNNGWF